MLLTIAMIALGAAGFAGFPAFKAYSEIKASTSKMAFFNVALSASGYLFLFRQSYTSYFSVRRALLPTLLSLCALIALSYALTAALAPRVPTSRLVVRHLGLIETYAQWWQPSLRTLLVAQGGLNVLILTSGLFKTSDPISNFTKQVGAVRKTRDGLKQAKVAQDEEEAARVRSALIFQLEQVADSIKKSGPDLDLITKTRTEDVSKAVKYLLASIPELALENFLKAKIVEPENEDVLRNLDFVADMK
jgi:hypothetical protein